MSHISNLTLWRSGVANYLIFQLDKPKIFQKLVSNIPLSTFMCLWQKRPVYRICVKMRMKPTQSTKKSFIDFFPSFFPQLWKRSITISVQTGLMKIYIQTLTSARPPWRARTHSHTPTETHIPHTTYLIFCCLFYRAYTVKVKYWSKQKSDKHITYTSNQHNHLLNYIYIKRKKICQQLTFSTFSTYRMVPSS